MTRRFIPLILAAAVALVGLVAAQDPDPGDAPVRLKKKNRDTEPAKDPAREPQNPDDKGGQPDKPDRLKGKEPGSEDKPEKPQAEDPREVLARVDRNLKAVVDRLENNELNDATRQRQDDILSDLESLIKQQESPQQNKSDPQQNKSHPMNQGNPMDQGGAGKQGNPMTQTGQQGQPMKQGGTGRDQKQGSGQGNAPAPGQANQPSGQGNTTVRDNPGNPGQPRTQGNPMPQPGPPQQGQPGTPTDPGPRQLNDKVDPKKGEPDDGTWGNMPEGLRAQMNAYQTRKNYSQRNRDLVDSYRRSLATPGQEKGN